MPQAATGDLKKIDFDVTGHGLRFAIEAKWAKRAPLDAKNDYEKLMAFHRAIPTSRSFFCVFGVKSVIQNMRLRNGTFTERGNPVFAEFGVTRYGCQMYEATI
jgi:hypothetical protein